MLSIFATILLLPSLVSAYYSNQQFVFSLGNGTSCEGMECNLVQIDLIFPKGFEKPQYVKFVIKPDCYANPPTENENYGILFYCLETNYTKTNYDLKPYMCNQEYLEIWKRIDEVWAENYDFKGNYYEVYRCIIERNSTNIQRLPTELSVFVDTLGLTTESQERLTDYVLDTGSKIKNGIGEIISINLNVWRIILIGIELMIIIFGAIFILGLVPLLIKKVVKGVFK